MTTTDSSTAVEDRIEGVEAGDVPDFAPCSVRETPPPNSQAYSALSASDLAHARPARETCDHESAPSSAVATDISATRRPRGQVRRTLVSIGLLGVSLIIGMLVATAIQPAATPDEPQSVPTREAETAGQFVQEPPQRTSRRPELPSAFQRSNLRSNFLMLRAFDEAIGDAWKSTVRVLDGEQQIALGAIVASDGWVITKASELPREGDVTCELYDNSRWTGKRYSTIDDLDLALIRLNTGSPLPALKWASAAIPDQGRWVATTDAQVGLPSAVGVVSAGAQKIRKSKAVLGVHLLDANDGALVTLVLPGSGADEAGLQIGDKITSVDGQAIGSRNEFLSAVGDAYGGHKVLLSYDRNGSTLDTEARLMDLSEELLDETEMEVSGHISSRATGFTRVFTHDTVLEPFQCGGPIVDLDGNAVGINIARAGRVATYALPVDVVKPVIESLVAQAKLVSTPADQGSSSLRPIR